MITLSYEFIRNHNGSSHHRNQSPSIGKRWKGSDYARCLSWLYVALPLLLESAMSRGTPSIISKQSGCAEILENCIKVDYWDIHALADAMYSICTNESLFKYLQEEGKREVDQITWEKVGAWIKELYERTLGWK